MSKMPTRARSKLDNGPAAAVHAMPFLGFLKYLALMGTGFAQPMPRNIMDRVPKGLKCFMGFSDILPRFLAVGSPNLYAAYP